MIAVLGTVCAWYVGDVLYNDYQNIHAALFTPDVIRNAWWQVCWFLLVFLFLAPQLNAYYNSQYLQRGSGIISLVRHGAAEPVLQHNLNQIFVICLGIWFVLTTYAVLRLKANVIYYLFPYLGDTMHPWGRGRIGGGFDALLTVAFYLEMIVSSLFGVVLALSQNRKIRIVALIACFVCWPYFIFERTRNSILTVTIPCIPVWVFLRVRGSIIKKFILISAMFLVVNAWMAFIISNRSEMRITDALREKGFSIREVQTTHHHGLNMFEELCWINTFIQQGTYTPNLGGRYFAELVNPVPRALWPGKPLMGIDYALLRGQGGESGQAGVFATISTGLIGQGVVNFGTIFGPAFAALLMAGWVVVLARLDLRIHEVGRLPLYGLGLILTFNLGRDITFITLYPFVFTFMLVLWLERRRPSLHTSFQPNKRRTAAGFRPPTPHLTSERESTHSGPRIHQCFPQNSAEHVTSPYP